MKIGIVKLYGYINEWGDNSARCFSERFEKAVADHDEIHLHIHTYGGSVFEGNLIYNTIKNCKKPVDVYIDGVSASMGSVIMLAARKVYMAENAFIMIHAPSGYTEGTAKDMLGAAKLLRTIEANFKTVYAAKTGKSESDIALWMDGDNWFGAKEAHGEKLIDGIVASVAKDVSVLESELKEFTAQTLYHRFAAELDNNNGKKESFMNKKEFIARYGLTGVTENNSDAEIYAALDKKIAEITSAEKTAKEQAQAELKAEKGKQITTMVEGAIAAKKITAAQKDQFVKIGETAGVEALQTALDAITPPKTITITSMLQGGGQSAASANSANWAWDEWQKNDPQGLEALAKTDPEKFQALYDAKYKK